MDLGTAEVGSYLVLGLDHVHRLAVLRQTTRKTDAARRREAERLAEKVPPDIPLVVVAKVVNAATGASTAWSSTAGPTVTAAAHKLRAGAYLLVSLDAAGHVQELVAAADEDAAYRAEKTRISPSVPRVLIAEITHRYA